MGLTEKDKVWNRKLDDRFFTESHWGKPWWKMTTKDDDIEEDAGLTENFWYSFTWLGEIKLWTWKKLVATAKAYKDDKKV